MTEKKILIISNACFSNSDSNGRTLAKLFQAFPQEQLAQIFVYGTPDFDVCKNYYQISDRDALRSFIKQKQYGGIIQERTKNFTQETAKKRKRTPFKMLLREIAWKFGRWKGKNLRKWIEEFDPDALFLSLADNVFFCRLAKRIAKERKIPVYVYSTEDYVFKKHNYLTKRPSLFYRWFRRWLRRGYKKLTPYVKYGIFNTPLLMSAYQEAYPYPCTCIFGQSDIDYVENVDIPEEITVSYLGNLGVGRHVPLVEIANTIREIDEKVKLDVYGRLPEGEAKESIEACENIRYKGFVSYEEVVEIIHKSTLLVHAEQNDPFYSKDLKYAFSTKIADSVCSGTPFLIYARKDLACTDFLEKNQCAFVAETSEALKKELYKALTDRSAREEVVKRAYLARTKYFTQNNRFKELIEAE